MVWVFCLVLDFVGVILEKGGGGGGGGADGVHCACVCPYAQAACS